jgi:hypothetical protein
VYDSGALTTRSRVGFLDTCMETLLTQRGMVTLRLILLSETVISDTWYEIGGQAELQTIAGDHLSRCIVIFIITRGRFSMVILTARRNLRLFSFGFLLE